MRFDKNRFQFRELYINGDNGKSSGSGFCGVWIIIISLLAFISCIVAYFLKLPFANELMGHIVIILGIGSALLGVRKVVGGKDVSKEESDLST